MRRGKQKKISANQISNSVSYRELTHSLSPQKLFTDEKIAALHDTALEALETLGIVFLLPEARTIFEKSGAIITGETVKIGRDIVDDALSQCPKTIEIKAPLPQYDRIYDKNCLLFAPAGGCPNVSDRLRGRRPGNADSYSEAVKLTQMMDVMHVQTVAPEPQDIPLHLRHIFMTETQLGYCDKFMSVYARGSAQTMQIFEMISTALDIDETSFKQHPHCMTVVNSNSPRIFDKSMSQALIDFAEYGQLSVITPFCLAGAMAPITIEGALLLQHMECLAGITLSQLVRSGAPVSYGGFASNVDMRSGSPAFGTPEHIKMQIVSGQLSRYIGLPWRSAAGSASNCVDAQGNLENTNAIWGALLSNANLVLHSAGWLEGGLTFDFEKFITDCETLQIAAEIGLTRSDDEMQRALSAIAETKPGGHFFDNSHTMNLYKDAFYKPINADLSNHGAWKDAGGLRSDQRASETWKNLLNDYAPSASAQMRAERLAPLTEKFRNSGGAQPLDG